MVNFKNYLQIYFFGICLTLMAKIGPLKKKSKYFYKLPKIIQKFSIIFSR